MITLSGHGELEVANGQKIAVGPGHINLIEDTTGKGHITQNLAPDDRVVLTIPLADQTIENTRAADPLDGDRHQVGDNHGVLRRLRLVLAGLLIAGTAAAVQFDAPGPRYRTDL